MTNQEKRIQYLEATIAKLVESIEQEQNVRKLLELDSILLDTKNLLATILLMGEKLENN